MGASITDNGNTKPTMMDMVLEWRDKHITDRQMTIILALFIGLFASVAAFILHFIIKEIQVLLTAGFSTVTYNWLYLVFPVIGIFLTSLFVRYVVKDNISHGITRILYAISSKRSRLKPHNCWTSVIASAITIGFGGSVGAEAPIVDRFKPRTAVQDGQQDPYAACGLWRCCRHCRHLQGSDSRTCVHP